MTDSMVFPSEMTPELQDILGRPNFVCGPIAHIFQAAGADIPRKAEAEQAFVLHWMIKLYLTHGDRWREIGEEELKEVRAAASVSAPAPED
ncbi:hypothetical protein LCGC14_0798050 [marine sediment metagenome]|uniref:Uncharacterized protein n=1 Tax=marine sediment metagenome TaxID=412755 RepID=A0A0F9QAA0_9ZZZZ